MKNFELARPSSVAQARELLADRPGAVFKAGGIDLLDHLKEHLVEPPRLVDLKGVAGMRDIAPQPDGSLRIGPLATLAEVAAHAGVRATHRALAQACGEAASPQIRNVATIGGNLLQRPRCWYYRQESYKCLKKGGDVCYAVGGENRYHAIFGGGPSYIVHPSNAAVPLVAMGAQLVLEGEKGPRTVAASDFFTSPSKDPERENQLQPGEVLTEIRVPAAAGWRGERRGEHGRPQGRARLPSAPHEDVLRDGPRSRRPERSLADGTVLVLADGHRARARRCLLQPPGLPTVPRLLRAGGLTDY